ncbi:hypothetical protein ABZ671_00645 [Micromonospora sp. NPDC006766]|uniref:hypothetical protein n=1 Tax=Micromonospora sp. NPDC006766 TaxID=3154778 RepID=UPI0033C102F0
MKRRTLAAAPQPKGTPMTDNLGSLRDQLRDLIATRIHAADCGCTDFRPDGSDADDVYYRRLADSVMDMFDGEITELWQVIGVSEEFSDEEWASYPKTREKALAYAREANTQPGTKAQAYRLFELRTTPEPIKEAHR